MIKVPKKYQLDLSNPNRRRVEDDAPRREMPARADFVVEKNDDTPIRSFRDRLAKKIASEEPVVSPERVVEQVKKKPLSLPKIFPKFKSDRKLDLRDASFVSPPQEIEDINENDELRPAKALPRVEPEIREPEYEIEPAKPVKTVKKKRHRKKKPTAKVAPIQAPQIIYVQVPAGSPIPSAEELSLLSAPPANLPVDTSQDAPQTPAYTVIPMPQSQPVNSAAMPSAIPAAVKEAPVKKKRKPRKKVVSESPAHQDVPVKISEPEDVNEDVNEATDRELNDEEFERILNHGESVVEDDEDEERVEEVEVEKQRVVVEKSDEEKLDERKSFRDSLEKKLDGDSGDIDSNGGYSEKILENGLRVIFAPMAGTKTITALVMFGTGSKYESLSQNGISHFLEHMFFKGTKNRPNAQKISSELDALGSEYNAFTAKEYTGYWIKVDATKADPALDILSDMLLNSKFSEAEIDKERGVIIEEINMYHENPMMYIEDLFEKCLYGETPAGREIIGPKENIKNFKRQSFIDYFSNQYGSNAATLVVSGAVDHDIEDAVKKYFDSMVKRPFKEKLRTPERQIAPEIRVHYQEGKQANMSLGVRTYDTYHPDKIILKVLSVILGGSMSSRLFNEVREKRGLAYYLRTQTEFFTDTGYLTTQAGVPHDKIGEAIETIVNEYRKMSEELVKEDELRRAKDLIRGRTVIAFEESDSVANWYARQSTLGEDVMTPDQFFEEVEKVTAEDIMRVAADIFRPNKLNLAVIGPFKGESQFEKSLQFKVRPIVPGIFGFFA